MRFLAVYLLIGQIYVFPRSVSDDRADICLTLLETAKLISKVIISICSPMSSVCEFQLLHIFANT